MCTPAATVAATVAFGQALGMKRGRGLLALVFLALGSCGGKSEGGPSVPDAATADAAAPDGGTCPDDPPCASGDCPRPVTTSAGWAWQLAADGKNLYWSNPESGVYAHDGTVGVVDRCTGATRWVYHAQAAPYGIAVADGVLCWANLGSTIEGKYEGDGSINCVKGGSKTVVAANVPDAMNVAIDAGVVYWVQTKPLSIYAQSVDGSGAATLLASAAVYSESGAIAVDATTVYASSESEILAVPKSGGDATLLVEAQVGIRWIGVDDVALYWNSVLGAGPDGDKIFTMPKSGGTPKELAVASVVGNQLALDDAYVYFAGDDSLRRVPKQGGAVEGLAAPAAPYALAVDDTFVYWQSASAIKRRHR